MCRLACSGILAKYPNLKFITHHAGAMIPFLAGRISQINPFFGKEGPIEEGRNNIKEHLTGQLQKFYNDTAIYGNTSALMCAQDFFGTDHLLFGSDMPYGPRVGETYLKATLDAIDGMNISEADKGKIYEGNARTLLRLDNKK
jgi:aminocarboxymuconate-semialdehyde decarboxylase